ncbi:MAG: ANTAR domain-containing protein [Lachnospiraceae bacterium]|nr:ANTAR domain-containing protein [Lachnospiraceae bacterium]
MRGNVDIQYSILIVSSQEQYDSLVKRALKPGKFMTVDVQRRVSSARRMFLERYYDIIVIFVPLPDETGLEFALDAAGQSSASVLLAVPAEIMDDVSNHVSGQGILTVEKKGSSESIPNMIRYLSVVQAQFRGLKRKLEAAEEKNEEIRLIGKAKLLLAVNKNMTEDEAHRYIGKQAMDNGVSRGRIARKILEEYYD